MGDNNHSQFPEGKILPITYIYIMSNQYENHYYNKHLQPYANKLRKRMTKAEACLWKYVLRAGTEWL